MTDAHLDRRRFLTGTSLVAGGAFLAGCGHEHDPYAIEKPPVPGSGSWARGEERFIATSCAQCAAGCGVRVRVVEGRAVRIVGNAASPINEGGIGPRGISGTQALYDPDRIRGPLRRTGGRGGPLEPATWDEAIAAIGAELTRLRGAGEAHRVGVITGRERGLSREAWMRFARAYGTPNLFGPLAGGGAPLALACELMQGVPEVPAYDWAGARYVLSFGSGLLDSCQSVAFARAQSRLRGGQPGRRAKIVHIGPAAGRAGASADEWIPIRAGTHGAFALGLAWVLVRDGHHDAGFVEEHGFGFEPWKDERGREHAGFRARLAQYTPEHVAELCGVAPRVVERIAHEIAAARPSFGWCASDELLASNGLATAMSVHALNALLGAIDRPGGLLVQRGPPLAPWKEFEPDEAAARSLATERLGSSGGARFPFGAAPLDALRDTLAEGRPYGLAALFLDYANPVYARADAAAWRAALSRIPLVVSLSPYLDETATECADWVLPDDTYLERFEDASAAPSVGRAVFGLRQPVVERLHDTRSAGDVLIALATALGDPIRSALPWKEFKDAVKQRVAGLHSAKRGSIVEEKGAAFLKRFYDVGVWVDEPYAYERWEETLRTPSGKFEFTSQRMLAAIDALAERSGKEPRDALAMLGLPPDVELACQPHHAEPRWEGEPSAFPLLLLPFRPSTYAEGSGANLPWLQELSAHAGRTTWDTEAELHPETAARLSIRSGDRIRIESPVGAIECRAWVSSAVHPEVVRVPQGGGHTALGRFARGVGANVMELVAARAVHPIAGFNALVDTRARVRRIG